MNHIKEIAELLECGFICFLHIENKTIESYLETDDFFFEDNPWQEVMDKIDSDYDNYIKITKMDSTQSFQVMERFTDQIDSDYFREKLVNALNRRKPFSNFKYLVEQSEYRQAWFDYRLDKNIEWVKEQIEDYNRNHRDINL